MIQLNLKVPLEKLSSYRKILHQNRNIIVYLLFLTSFTTFCTFSNQTSKKIDEIASPRYNFDGYLTDTNAVWMLQNTDNARSKFQILRDLDKSNIEYSIKSKRNVKSFSKRHEPFNLIFNQSYANKSNVSMESIDSSNIAKKYFSVEQVNHY